MARAQLTVNSKEGLGMGAENHKSDSSISAHGTCGAVFL